MLAKWGAEFVSSTAMAHSMGKKPKNEPTVPANIHQPARGNQRRRTSHWRRAGDAHNPSKPRDAVTPTSQTTEPVSTGSLANWVCNQYGTLCEAAPKA